jgi:thiol-disulfide isomerase/thioredoxin
MKPTLRLLFALLLCGIALPAHAKRVPDLAFKDLSGHTQKLSTLRGEITVLSFWATWCAPCRDELPRLSKLKDEYAPKGVRFVAISADEPKDRPKIDSFLKTANLTLDVWTGADLDTLDHLSLGNELPATILLDQNGEPVARILGEAQDSDIRTRLDWLLNGRQGPAPEPVVKHY